MNPNAFSHVYAIGTCLSRHYFLAEWVVLCPAYWNFRAGTLGVLTYTFASTSRCTVSSVSIAAGVLSVRTRRIRGNRRA